MRKGVFFLSILLTGALFGAPQALPLQEIRLSLDEISYQVHGHQVEIDLFQERLSKLEKKLETPHEALGRSLEGRLARLEKAQEGLVQDVKNMKNHLNEAQSALAACQSKLGQLDQQVKRSLESILAHVQNQEDSPSSYYIVKPGDSLGQIALDHKTDIKTLKQFNHLSTDTIFVGQKLSIPK